MDHSIEITASAAEMLTRIRDRRIRRLLGWLPHFIARIGSPKYICPLSRLYHASGNPWAASRPVCLPKTLSAAFSMHSGHGSAARSPDDSRWYCAGPVRCGSRARQRPDWTAHHSVPDGHLLLRAALRHHSQ